MLQKYHFILVSGIALLIAFQVSGQDLGGGIVNGTERNTLKNDSLQTPLNSTFKPCISPFIEIMGKGFFSVNVDYRIKETYALSVGFQPTEGLLPDVMYYYFFGKRHRLEVGGGVSTGFSQKLHLEIMLFHGTIGYRYQKKKGLSFRIGFTPLYVWRFSDIDRTSFYPFGGLSLGYSF
jgi:hypothetical protein